MIRLLSIIIAVLAGVIGWLTETPWLYLAAAGLILVGIVVSLGSRRSQYRREKKAERRPPPAREASPEDELSALGISNVRPKSRSPESADPGAGTAEVSDGTEAARSFERRPPTGSQSRTESPPTLFDAPKSYPSGTADATGAGPRKEFEQILLPYLQSLQSACGAHTACLLEVDAPSDQFRVAGVASKSGYVRRRARFARASHFLSRLSGEQSVYELPVDGNTLKPEDLEFYSEPVAVSAVLAAPVTTSAGTVGYLILDSLADDPPIAKANHAIIVEFANLLGRIMEHRQIAPRTMAAPKEAPPSEARERPRREIIAEEIQSAREKQSGLALALVYLDDGEQIARQGSEELQRAEQALAAYLKQETAGGRVERFGELMFGVFHRSTAEDVDGWAQRIQQSIARGDGAPAGGRVSIGVAILSERHAGPEDLREDATNALREAFETGDCIILE